MKNIKENMLEEITSIHTSIAFLEDILNNEIASNEALFHIWECNDHIKTIKDELDTLNEYIKDNIFKEFTKDI